MTDGGSTVVTLTAGCFAFVRAKAGVGAATHASVSPSTAAHAKLMRGERMVLATPTADVGLARDT